VIIAFITVIIIVLIFIVFWKEKKNRRCNKPEEVYYSTIDEVKVKIAKNKPEVVNSETEAHYTDIAENIYSTITNKVTLQLQDNPSYFIPSDHPHKIKDDPACEHKIVEEAYAIL